MLLVWGLKLTHLCSGVSTQPLHCLAVWFWITALASLVLCLLIHNIKCGSKVI